MLKVIRNYSENLNAMLCTSTPPESPGSEISVGSPSPLPSESNECNTENETHNEDYFRPLKRLKMVPSKDDVPPETQSQMGCAMKASKSTIEGVKSFSIADILGRGESEKNSASQHHPDTQENIHTQTRIVRPWDHLQHPISVRPFLPPALLHYEQRLAMDYHQQLQEHFRAQAQLLRHMNLEIIPSESGSERSSSVASECCSPELGRNSDSQQQNSHNNTINSNSSSKTKSPNGTPLDALFQMTSKTFDETQTDGGEYEADAFIYS